MLIKGLLWLVVCAFCYPEINDIWFAPKNLESLFSSVGTVVLALYLILFIAGLVLAATSFWRPDLLERGSRYARKIGWFRLILIGGIPVSYAYILLYSPWQDILSTPWLGLLFSASLVQIVLFLAASDKAQTFSWNELALTLIVFLYPRIVQEARALLPSALQYRLVTVLGLAVVFLMMFALYSQYKARITQILLQLRERMGRLWVVFVVLFCLIPVFYRYSVTADVYVFNDDIRFAVLLAAVWGVAYFGSKGSNRIITLTALGLGTGVMIFVAHLTMDSLLVVNYPFSLYWSEGNRFYDYSLLFGESIYKYEGTIPSPYSAPGRYVLWGILFLWQGLPIWMHRLWNLIITTIPALFFAVILTRKLTPAALRYGMLLWITLFMLILAPLHPPIVIAVAIVFLFAFTRPAFIRLFSVIFAGAYVAISRFTWVFAPSAIGVLIDLLLYYPKRQGAWWHRLMPALLIGVLGSVLGVVRNYGALQANTQAVLTRSMDGSDMLQTTETVKSIAGQQALLWERLLPNNTLPMGVLFLVLMYTLPVLFILIWWMVSKNWTLDLLQKLSIWGILAAFFIVGLIISTKIGGGGDLHNMDMYLLTLFSLFVLGLMSGTKDTQATGWPVWGVVFVLYFMGLLLYPFTPFHPGSREHTVLKLPLQKDVDESLQTIQSEVQDHAATGEILFIDHRQLLTFKYVSGVSLVPEYEKKYMMDQAMAKNTQYFHTYYEDLANRRFSLIVTELLSTNLKTSDEEGPFPDENDAWVRWVSIPTLCYYEPIFTSKTTRVQLLIPRASPTGCEQYLK